MKQKQTEQAYKIICRKKTDPFTWFVKCNCATQAQAEKFIEILSTAADVYIELRCVPITESLPVPKNSN